MDQELEAIGYGIAEKRQPRAGQQRYLKAQMFTTPQEAHDYMVRAEGYGELSREMFEVRPLFLGPAVNADGSPVVPVAAPRKLAAKLDVFLDGEMVPCSGFFSIEEGWVEVYAKTATLGDGLIAHERRYGYVEAYDPGTRQWQRKGQPKPPVAPSLVERAEEERGRSQHWKDL